MEEKLVLVLADNLNCYPSPGLRARISKNYGFQFQFANEGLSDDRLCPTGDVTD